jgi:cell division inhibitor SepF
MMAALNKIFDYLGMGTKREDEEYDELDLDANYYMEEEEPEQQQRNVFGKKSKVVPMPNQNKVKMVIVQPTSFEEACAFCANIKERKSVVLNLEHVDNGIARRIIDYVAGVCYGLEGHIQKVSNQIFLVAPYNYEIANELERGEKDRFSVSWKK